MEMIALIKGRKSLRVRTLTDELKAVGFTQKPNQYVVKQSSGSSFEGLHHSQKS